jgi:hypothetical protein
MPQGNGSSYYASSNMNRYIKESEHEINESEESYIETNSNMPIGQLP